MGISGLLPFVKNACRKGNIQELRGKSVAIDVSCLLHRGLTGCMDKIHMGEETQSYVNYVDKYVKELLAMGCHVVMVFDGRPLPAKKGTNDDRREAREKRKEHAEMLLAKGKEREARDHYRLATSISAEIVEKTIEFFRAFKNVDIVVAPYEADAQLAYLMSSKLVDAVVTEDSDLIVFGCERIYFKWQSANGECQVYEKDKLRRCFTGELGGDKFDFPKFRRICILSGCDYLQSGLPGVGLTTAAKFFSLTSIKDLRTVLRKVPSYLKNPKLKEHVTDEFIRNFERAENTFKHQIVFDPRERCQKPLTPYPVDLFSGDDDDFGMLDLESPTKNPTAAISTNFTYAGQAVTQRIAIRLALGNPADGNAIDDKFLLFQPTPEWSVWALRYESRGMETEREQRKRDEEAQQCGGGAFKLDSPAVQKRPKLKKTAPEIDDDEESDDIVKQFMADIEKEKQALKKRKNAPQSDYNAENVLKKYCEEPVAKKTKIAEAPPIVIIDDDFSELFETKNAEILDAKSSEKAMKIEQKSTEKSQFSTEKTAILKPIPILKKSTSTPESSVRRFSKFQSPLLTQRNSAPLASGDSEKILRDSEKAGNSKNANSKYFGARKLANSNENGPPKTSSPSTKNPFRCPAFIKPSPCEKLAETSEIPEKSTILATLEDNSTVSTNSTISYRFVGFKSAGLRRKSKN